MFPFLSDLIEYLFGISIPLPFPMFGFMVAIAFIAANLLFVQEMKRKEEQGWLSATKTTVIKGAGASFTDLLSNAFFGFLIGFKGLEAFYYYSDLVADPQAFILSARGNVLGGIVVGAIMTYWKYREAEKQRLPQPRKVDEVMHPYQHVGTMTFIAAIGGILGAKLFDAIEDIERLISDPIQVIFSGSGLSIYGGLIVGGGSVVYYAYKKGLKWVHVVDACAPGLMLAYGIGRIGCQLSGDGDWGMPNDAPKPEALSFLPDWMWAFDYPGNVNGVILKEDFQRMGLESITGNAWPTPFYETVMAFIIFAILWSFRKKIKVPGVMFSIYLIFNGIERFFIEKIRINPVYDILGMEATQAEVIAVIMFFVGIAGVWLANVKKDIWSKRNP